MEVQVMTASSILVPTDFSATSDAALRYATDMALALGARLDLLYVPAKTGEHQDASYPIGRFETEAHEQLSSFVSPEQLARLRPEYALRVGSPSDEIVYFAETSGIDLIIMGTHGRTGLAHVLMGSVAEDVARRAPCPVLLFRVPRRVTVAEGDAAAVQPARTTLGLRESA
jgi:nucleotide-binding universal stress UspA family protein